MSADILPFTPKHAAAYDRAVEQTLADCMPLFVTAFNGHAIRPVPVDTDQSLEDGAGGSGVSAITEASAKTKWCPFVQVAPGSIDTHAYTNREVTIGDLPQGEASRCIGSACMAWRVLDDGWEFVEFGQTSPFKVAKDIPPPDGWIIFNNGSLDIGWKRQSRQSTGYCGLAGKP